MRKALRQVRRARRSWLASNRYQTDPNGRGRPHQVERPPETQPGHPDLVQWALVAIKARELIWHDPDTDRFPSSVYTNFSGVPLPYRWNIRAIP